jgi:3-methyladenine DNA glycosylase AlkD
MTKNEALTIANNCIHYIENGKIDRVWNELLPVLNEKTSFQQLDIIGGEIGKRAVSCKDKYMAFFDLLSDRKLMGGYVVIAQALTALLQEDCRCCFERAKTYMIAGDEWYVCDTFGERVLGYAMIDHYDKTQSLFQEFVSDDNHWVRRSVGVAAHFFAKRCRGDKRDDKKATEILALLTPQLCERDIRILKGIGWGLKALGRYYPDLLIPYIKTQISSKRISAVIIRKCVTYLDDISRNEILQLYQKKKTS